MNGTPFRLWTFPLFGVLMSCAWGAAEDIDPRLEKALADWQKRQHAFRSVRYEVRGERVIPKGAYDVLARDIGDGKLPHGQAVPAEKLVGELSLMLLLDFDKGRHRREIREPTYHMNSGKLVPWVKANTFDGSVAKAAMPREENPGLGSTMPEFTVVSGNMKSGEFHCNYFPIFFGHGRIYTVFEPIIPGKLRNNPDSGYLYVHGTGVYDRRTCLIVRTQTLKRNTTSFDEYWVDTERESAILRHVAYCNSKPSHDITIEYRKALAGWLPASWVLTFYQGGNLMYSDTMRAENISLNPPVRDADFQMEMKTGMIVEERMDLPTKHPLMTPKSNISIYRVKEEGKREELPDPYHRKGDQHQERLQRKNLWVWAWWSLPLLAIGVSFLWFRRRRHYS